MEAENRQPRRIQVRLLRPEELPPELRHIADAIPTDVIAQAVLQQMQRREAELKAQIFGTGPIADAAYARFAEITRGLEPETHSQVLHFAAQALREAETAAEQEQRVAHEQTCPFHRAQAARTAQELFGNRVYVTDLMDALDEGETAEDPELDALIAEYEGYLAQEQAASATYATRQDVAAANANAIAELRRQFDEVKVEEAAAAANMLRNGDLETFTRDVHPDLRVIYDELDALREAVVDPQALGGSDRFGVNPGQQALLDMDSAFEELNALVRDVLDGQLYPGEVDDAPVEIARDMVWAALRYLTARQTLSAVQIIDETRALFDRKESDYAHREPLINIKAVEERLGITAYVGVLVRLGDKMSRIANLVEREQTSGEGPAVADESIVDTVRDVINYGFIFVAMWRREVRGDARWAA